MGSLRAVMVGLFTPQKSANAISQRLICCCVDGLDLK